MNSDRLWDAIDRLKAHPESWSKGNVTGNTRCLIGHVLNNDNYEGFGYIAFANLPEARLLHSVICDQYLDRVVRRDVDDFWKERPSTAVWRFNDHRDTTVNDVIRVLEKAAIRADELV